MCCVAHLQQNPSVVGFVEEFLCLYTAKQSPCHGRGGWGIGTEPCALPSTHYRAPWVCWLQGHSELILNTGAYALRKLLLKIHTNGLHGV